MWLKEVCVVVFDPHGTHTRAKGDKRSQAALKCCWKWKVLLLIPIKASRRRIIDQP
jgi:hypothetical protein